MKVVIVYEMEYEDRKVNSELERISYQNEYDEGNHRVCYSYFRWCVLLQIKILNHLIQERKYAIKN